MRAIGTVIFDLDGTLIDLQVPIDDVRGQLTAFFSARGYRRPMRPILTAIDEGAKQTSSSPTNEVAVRKSAMDILDRAEVHAVQVAPLDVNVKPLLEKLLERGFEMAIVTNNSRACVAAVLKRLELDNVFAAVVARDDVQTPKPDPEGLLRVWTKLGEPVVLYFVGDSTADVVAARQFEIAAAAPITMIGVSGGRHDLETLRTAGADRLIETLNDLAQVL